MSVQTQNFANIQAAGKYALEASRSNPKALVVVLNNPYKSTFSVEACTPKTRVKFAEAIVQAGLVVFENKYFNIFGA